MSDIRIGDEVYIHGFVDEVRKDAVIIKNEGGYFGTVADEIMPSARPEQRWIPCSERLPKVYDNYLITTYDGNVDIGTIDPKKQGVWSACDADGFYWLREVIAWMPLPAPWRGANE